MAEKPLSESEQALRDEIRAAIAASRDLEPSMDEHLADSVLARYRETTRAQQATQQAPAVRQAGSAVDSLARALVTIAVLAFILGLVVYSRGSFWWLFFIIFPLFGWHRWGYDYSHHSDSSWRAMRDQARTARYEARAAYYRQCAAQWRDDRDSTVV
jgi:fatty acid desaturase